MDGGPPRRFRVRSLLLMLVGVSFLPIAFFAVALLARHHVVITAQTEGQVHVMAERLAEDVDREIARITASLEVLTTSEPLLRDDLGAFYRRAVELRDTLGTNIVLRDLTGQQVVNSRVPWGTPLPKTPIFEVDRRALDTERPQVSGLLTGGITRRPLLIAVTPVIREDEAVYLLSMTISLEMLQGMVASRRLPPGWIAGVFDRDGTILARTVGGDQLVGTRLPERIWSKTREVPEGIHRMINLEGAASFQAFHPSLLSEWAVGVLVPESLVGGPSRQYLLAFVAGGIFLSLLSLGAAVMLERRLERPIGTLAGVAGALGEGRPVPPGPFRIAELDQVGGALRQAARNLEERRAELLESQARLQAITDSVPSLVWSARPDGVVDYYSRRCEQYAGFDRNEDGTWQWAPAVHPDETPVTVAAWARAVETGEPYEIEHRIRMADGTYRWHISRAVPARDEAGGVVRWYGSASDVHELKLAEESLRASEERLRFERELLSAVIRQAPVGVSIAEAPSGRVLALNDKAVELLGHSASGSDVGRYREFGAVHADGRPYAIDDYPTVRAIRRGEVIDREEMIYRRGGAAGTTTTRLEVSSAPVRNATGEIVAAATVFIDVEEQRQAEERQSLLMREVDHRAKNALAVVQAVVRLTKADTMEAFVEAVQGRVSALARAHSLLARSRWTGADLRSLIREELEPYAGGAARGRLIGPSVTIAAEAVQSLGMVFHELATNAAKYGALSVPDGTVEVRWQWQADGGLEMVWQEAGGPVVHEPERRGFGSTMIAGAIASQLGGTVDFKWGRRGLCCEFTVPGSRVSGESRLPTPGVAAAPAPSSISLRGRTILVVEDDALIAAGIDADLRAMGCWPAGPVATLEEGLRLATSSEVLDAAILDVNLRGKDVWPVAEALQSRGVPYLFATGYGDIARLRDDAPVLEKPFGGRKLQSALQRLLREAEPAGS